MGMEIRLMVELNCYCVRIDSRMSYEQRTKVYVCPWGVSDTEGFYFIFVKERTRNP